MQRRTPYPRTRARRPRRRGYLRSCVVLIGALALSASAAAIRVEPAHSRPLASARPAPVGLVRSNPATDLASGSVPAVPAVPVCGPIPTATLAPGCGPLWGMALPVDNSATAAAVADYERAVGRPMDIVHTYHRWFDQFPTASEVALAKSGHLVLINWEPTDASGRPMSWVAIAAGREDVQIDAVAAKLRAMPLVALSFSHEPELNYGAHGNAAAFVAAFRHVHDRVRADGATNARWVWGVMGLTNPVWLARYPSLWPGDAYVDWVAWDPYNWASCRREPWRSFAQVVSPFYRWLIAAGHGNKPFMLAEYGSVEKPDDPQARASWFAGIPRSLATMPKLKALVYFDLPAPPANCDWQLDSFTPDLSAFERLAANGF